MTQSIFQRAKLNLILADMLNYSSNSSIYAYECIDLIDILRQENDDVIVTSRNSDEAVLVEMENHSKDIIDEVARRALKKQHDENSVKIRELDMSSEASSSTGNNGYVIGNDNKDIADQKMSDTSIVDPSSVAKDLKALYLESPTKKDSENGSHRKFLFSKKRRPEEMERMEQRRKEHEIRIEGHLRVGTNLRPLKKYEPLSRENPDTSNTQSST